MNIKWIPGYEGRYAVTDDGLVASYTCSNAAHGVPIWLIPRWYGSKSQYLSVKLCKDGKYKTRPVHQLVLETFVGPRPQGMLALHHDDNANNNNLDNLYWGTHKQNVQDAVHNGHHHSVRRRKSQFASALLRSLIVQRRRQPWGEVRGHLRIAAGLGRIEPCRGF